MLREGVPVDTPSRCLLCLLRRTFARSDSYTDDVLLWMMVRPTTISVTPMAAFIICFSQKATDHIAGP